jgi:aldose 1-epimerase
MRGYVENTMFFEDPALKAGNEQFEITIVPGWGSNLISFIEKKSNQELLRVPKSADEYKEKPVLYGTPLLFPPNRISDGTFTFNERSYQFEVNEQDKNNHIHGFVMTRKWDVIKAEADDHKVVIETEFNSLKHEDILKQFPHPFIIRMTYVLDENRLQKKATIINNSNDPFPWGFGFHTSFLFPEETCSFSLTAEKRWTLNDRFLPTGELEEIQYLNELKAGMNLQDVALDDVFLSSAKEGERNEAVLLNEETGIGVTYSADENFKHWVVYNDDGKQGFVCPEPYTWVTNAPNLNLPREITGLQVLAPGEKKVLETEISFSYKRN